MAFKNLNETDLLKLKLVETLSIEDLTVLIQNKDRILNKNFNSLDIKNVGFGGLYKEKTAFIILKNENELIKYEVNTYSKEIRNRTRPIFKNQLFSA